MGALIDAARQARNDDISRAAQPMRQSLGEGEARRNRLVSGLALGTVVIEAARNSGSLITARFAAEQNREVFAAPGSPLDPRAEGTNDLLRDGATICTSAQDVLNVLDPVRARDPFVSLRETIGEPTEALWGEQRLLDIDPDATPRSRSGGELDEPAAPDPLGPGAQRPVRTRVLELLSPSPIAIDDLVRVCEAPIRDVRVALLELDLAGRIEHSGGNRVALLTPEEKA